MKYVGKIFIMNAQLMYSDQSFLGHIVTCTTSGCGETLTHQVTPYENANGKLLDEVPRTSAFLMF